MRIESHRPGPFCESAILARLTRQQQSSASDAFSRRNHRTAKLTIQVISATKTATTSALITSFAISLFPGSNSEICDHSRTTQLVKSDIAHPPYTSHEQLI